MRPTLLICEVLLVGLAIGFYLGCEYGRFRGALDDFERRYEDDRQLVAPILASDPAFGRIVTVNFPLLGICLSGYVRSQQDYDRLRAEMLRLFGEPRVGHVMQEVSVDGRAEPVVPPDRGGK